jgi:hypothetical protein
MVGRRNSRLGPVWFPTSAPHGFFSSRYTSEKTAPRSGGFGLPTRLSAAVPPKGHRMLLKRRNLRIVVSNAHAHHHRGEARRGPLSLPPINIIPRGAEDHVSYFFNSFNASIVSVQISSNTLTASSTKTLNHSPIILRLSSLLCANFSSL